jgi:hypothetical protein
MTFKEVGDSYVAGVNRTKIMDIHNINLVAKDSPFIEALVETTKFRRSLVKQGFRAINGADILGDNPEQLASLVNQCFWSSIEVEEGRAVKGSICICSPDEAPLSRSFVKAVPVSIKILVDLLTASPKSSLAVHSGKEGQEIWGVLDSVPFHTLRLRIAATGTVVASSNENVIAVLQSGKVHIPKAASELDWMSLVAATFDSARPYPDRLKLTECLLRVVVTIHRHGHGGALVLVPTNDLWKQHIKFSYEFEKSSALALRGRIQQWETAIHKAKQIECQLMMGQNTETPSLVPLHIQARESNRAFVDLTLRSIGDLSAIDGALIMDNEMTVLGFGAKLHATVVECKVIFYDALRDQVEKVAPVAELGGTRHQSAARFVHENNDALVFVASQDVHLTLFVWVINDSMVMAVRNLEHFIWEYRQ